MGLIITGFVTLSAFDLCLVRIHLGSPKLGAQMIISIGHDFRRPCNDELVLLKSSVKFKKFFISKNCIDVTKLFEIFHSTLLKTTSYICNSYED